jgi:sulfatase maturation enzyme AslB (radical SAM superfamily)
MRQMFKDQVKSDLDGIQFVDIRNTNFCNLKCRYCGPRFSSRWDSEIKGIEIVTSTDITPYIDMLFQENLHWLYFTGGEPLISSDHWKILELLIDKGLSKNISLLYNTNLSTLTYKNKNVFNLWEQFKFTSINVSIDATGEPLSYIRSGSDWNKIEANIGFLYKNQTNILSMNFTPVISVLNIWFLHDLLVYAKDKNINVTPTILDGPDYLSLNVIPDKLKDLALKKVEQVSPYLSPEIIQRITFLITNNINQGLFSHTLSHILVLDNLRNESMFNVLPEEFKEYAINATTDNND